MERGESVTQKLSCMIICVLQSYTNRVKLGSHARERKEKTPRPPHMYQVGKLPDSCKERLGTDYDMQKGGWDDCPHLGH